MAENVFEGLTPELVWNYFSDICEIPRESGNEKAMGEYIEKVGLGHGCEVRRDDLGNVVIKVPATKGRENSPVVIIQGHLDMVCEKNKSSNHDFEKDSIKPLRDGEWITADGTTLGADNGIAMAAGLAILDDEEAVHGPLELFFTVDEESGMTGVKYMKPSLLEGRIMLNLDSEEDGVLYIGCAGGLDTRVSFDVEFEEVPSGFIARQLVVNGLKGGHSGVDIHLGRGNAVKLMERTIAAIGSAIGNDNIRLAAFQGGSKRNAIPRESEAIVFISESKLAAFDTAISDFNKLVKVEYTIQEPDLLIEAISAGSNISQVLVKSDSERLLQFVAIAPNGVIQYSAAVHGLVETSTNLGVAGIENGKATIVLLTRSSLDGSVANVARSVAQLGKLIFADVDQEAGYPGWNPSLSSDVLKKCKAVYEIANGSEPKVTAIHAGLECAIIGGKFPDMDMISFGPTIEFPHSPDERIKIDTVDNFYSYTKEVLKALSE